MRKTTNINIKEFEKINKDYYRYQEDYDWIKVTDKIIGLESLFHRLRENSFLKILKNYLKSSNQKILDAGCGTGLFSRYLPLNSYAVDLNPRNLEKAKKYAQHINFIEADLEQLPFAENFFSLIIATEVIEHFPSPQKFLKEMLRVLRPDGFIIGTVPNRSFIWRLRFLSSTRPREPYHYYYNRKELKNLFNNEFKIVKLNKCNFGMTWLFILNK